jgi:peptidoglycan/LPS O-acetylase OafA/YrhL
MYNGFRGVDLFFVLSGFILMHVHGSDFRRVTYAETRDFYILRFFRVYPLNTVVLLALLPIGLAMPGLVQWFRYDHGVPIPYHSHDFSLAGFVQSLFLAQTWTVLKLGEWNGPSWTLSAEVFGYALFPLLASLLIRQRSRAACLCLALGSLATLVVLLEAFGHGRDNPTGSFGLIRMLFCFVAGMSLSRCRQLWPTTSSPGTLVTLSSIAVCAATLLSPATCLLIVFGFAGLIFGLAFRQGPVNAIMESRLAMFMGRISFSFYLIHFIPLKVSLWLMQTQFADTSLSFRLLYLVGLVAFCVALATVTHHLLEVPFQRLARRLLAREHAPAGRVRTA